MAEVTLQYPEALLALPVAWLLLLLFAWRRRFKPFGPFLLRLAIVVLAILALAQPVRRPPAVAAANERQQRLVILVDQSASLGQAGQAQLRAEAARLARESLDSVVVYFADQAVVVPPESPAVTWLDSEVSDLARAFRMGAGLLKERPGRLVLLSDGLATGGDPLDEAARLDRPVDVLPAGPADGSAANEVRLVKLSAPPILRQGETFAAEVTVHSQAAVEVTLRVDQDGQVLAEDVVALEPGANLFSFEVKAGQVGLHTLRAGLAAAPTDDALTVNNSLATFNQVYPPPRVLVVGEEMVETARLASQLQEAGFEPDRLPPQALPDRLSELEQYTGMVMLNVSARTLKYEQMLAVQEFVRSLGRGLLATGGRNSFSLGHYEDTPLADLLPVSMEPPPREERPPVALLLIIDHSGSMIERGDTTKLTMAKEAAIRATDVLGPQDLLGVLIFDDTFEWIVPFQPVSDGAALLEIQSRIARIAGGGGTHILDALEEGLPALATQDVGTTARHAVLLTDGQSFDGTRGREDYNRAVDAALAADITLSTIALGTGADTELLNHLAERGQGRYHFAELPEELPALTIAESAILRSNALQEGEFRPAVFAPHPMLRGLIPVDAAAGEEWPELSGYVAMTPKPRAEVALQVGPGDPLLSVWGYGLGRVAAWSADTGAEWADTWPGWLKAAQFWGQLVGYTLPAPGLGLLQLQTGVEAGGLVTINADGITPTGQPVDLARTQATLVTPAGRSVPLNLRQVAPGRYQQQVRLAAPGAYQLSVVQARPGGEPEERVTTGLPVPYPAEYGLPLAGTGRPLLEQIARQTGGQLLASGQPLFPGVPAVDPADPARQPVEAWPYLLLAALLLWPLEIAWRRWSRLRIQ